METSPLPGRSSPPPPCSPQHLVQPELPLQPSPWAWGPCDRPASRGEMAATWFSFALADLLPHPAWITQMRLMSPEPTAFSLLYRKAGGPGVLAGPAWAGSAPDSSLGTLGQPGAGPTSGTFPPVTPGDWALKRGETRVPGPPLPTDQQA